VRPLISQGPGRLAVRPPFRHHGGCFLLDLAAGSLALEKIGNQHVLAWPSMARGMRRTHEAQYSGTISYQYCTAPGWKSKRNKSGSCAEAVFNKEVKIGNKNNNNKKDTTKQEPQMLVVLTFLCLLIS
jgi:hypothetical protein